MLWSNFPEFGFYRAPWSLFRELQREMNGGYEQVPGSQPGSFPPINAWANEEKITVMAELPGFRAEEIDISVLGKALTITGERKPQGANGSRLLKGERFNGRFSRSLELPYATNTDGVQARLLDGVLEVTLLRAEEDKPKKILVK